MSMTGGSCGLLGGFVGLAVLQLAEDGYQSPFTPSPPLTPRNGNVVSEEEATNKSLVLLATSLRFVSDWTDCCWAGDRNMKWKNNCSHRQSRLMSTLRQFMEPLGQRPRQR
jgi:hypothetical protein